MVQFCHKGRRRGGTHHALGCCPAVCDRNKPLSSDPGLVLCVIGAAAVHRDRSVVTPRGLRVLLVNPGALHALYEVVVVRARRRQRIIALREVGTTDGAADRLVHPLAIVAVGAPVRACAVDARVVDAFVEIRLRRGGRFTTDTLAPPVVDARGSTRAATVTTELVMAARGGGRSNREHDDQCRQRPQSLMRVHSDRDRTAATCRRWTDDRRPPTADRRPVTTADRADRALQAAAGGRAGAGEDNQLLASAAGRVIIAA